MKSLVFDAGPVISLTMNNLLWILEPLKQRFQGEFYIPEAVRRELVDKPLDTKRFKFEALQVARLIHSGVLKVLPEQETKALALHLLELANTSLIAKGNFLNIVHYGEISVLAAMLQLKAEAIVVDERTTRELLERPSKLLYLMKKKLDTDVSTHKPSLSAFSAETRGARIFRSAELVTVAFELGLLNPYLDGTSSRRLLLESILWGVKLNGCSVSKKEIDQIIGIEERRGFDFKG